MLWAHDAPGCQGAEGRRVVLLQVFAPLAQRPRCLPGRQEPQRQESRTTSVAVRLRSTQRPFQATRWPRRNDGPGAQRDARGCWPRSKGVARPARGGRHYAPRLPRASGEGANDAGGAGRAAEGDRRDPRGCPCGAGYPRRKPPTPRRVGARPASPHRRYAGAVPNALDNLIPEERHRIYEMLRLKVLVYPDARLQVSGVLGTDQEVCVFEPLSRHRRSPSPQRRAGS